MPSARVSGRQGKRWPRRLGTCQSLTGFGDRAYFKGDYFLKAAAATVGYLANDPEEASYPVCRVDSQWAPAITALKRQFGIGAELIEAYFHPYLHLNHDLIRDKGLDQAVVEQAVAAELLKFKGVAYAVSSTALRTASLPDSLLVRSIMRNFHPKCSGDICLVFEPNVFINDFDGLTVASAHGSPWRYDTFVPVIFAGAGLPRQR